MNFIESGFRKVAMPIGHAVAHNAGMMAHQQAMNDAQRQLMIEAYNDEVADAMYATHTGQVSDYLRRAISRGPLAETDIGDMLSSVVDDSGVDELALHFGDKKMQQKLKDLED